MLSITFKGASNVLTYFYFTAYIFLSNSILDFCLCNLCAFHKVIYLKWKLGLLSNMLICSSWTVPRVLNNYFALSVHNFPSTNKKSTRFHTNFSPSIQCPVQCGLVFSSILLFYLLLTRCLDMVDLLGKNER